MPELKCPLCQEWGHEKEKCRFYVPPGRARKRSDDSQEMKGEESGRRSPRGKMPPTDRSRHQCYNCHKMGHWKAECPLLLRDDKAMRAAAQNLPPLLRATHGLWQDAHPSVGIGALREQAAQFNKPMPANIDITIPGICKAWEWFQRMDADESGRLDKEEVKELGKQLGVKWSNRDLSKAYESMTTVNGFYTTQTRTGETAAHNLPSNGKGASFQDFATWFARYTAVERRNIRRAIKVMFEALDTDASGLLDKDEFTKLVEKAEHRDDLPHFLGPDSKFEVDSEWDSMAKVAFGEGTELGINFATFEGWWREKVGIRDTDVPVLPEYLVSQASAKVKSQQIMNAAQTGIPLWQLEHKPWDSTRRKLTELVRMQRQWGGLWDIYETRNESVFDNDAVGISIRDPESTFSTLWDMVSLSFLLYVTATAPIRACFGIEDELWSTTFWFDLVVDVFFGADIAMNFRTAFYDSNGFREKDPKKIAVHYIQHWFIIDLMSCLPVGYIQYFFSDSNTGGEVRGVKAFRLLKLTKMLRLARLKRILSRHAGNVNYQQYFNVGLTFFIILLLVHLLTCFFYLIGDGGAEILANGVIVDGWVAQERNWWGPGNSTDPAEAALILKPDPSISLRVRYATSMYYMLNSLSRSYTTAEKWFGIVADFIRDIILGLVASVMTSITMSMADDDNTVSLRLKHLKQWMKARHLPKGFQSNAMEYFNELWSNQTIQIDDLIDECPPAMASSMTHLLYGRVLSTVPPFRGLSTEVIGALCLKCKPLMCMKDQIVIRQGEPGQEMYMVMSGELEVAVRDEELETSSGGRNLRRLGFLSEGAFFGEAPVLAPRDETSMLLRMRTVTAVAPTELCYLTRDALHEVCADFAELQARVDRFRNSAATLNDTRLKHMGMTRDSLQRAASVYKAKQQKTSRIRAEMNLDATAYVPSALMPHNPFTMSRARAKFKKGKMSPSAVGSPTDAADSAETSLASPGPPGLPGLLGSPAVPAAGAHAGGGGGGEGGGGGGGGGDGMAEIKQLLNEQKVWLRQSIVDFEMRQDQKLAELSRQVSDLAAAQ